LALALCLHKFISTYSIFFLKELLMNFLSKLLQGIALIPGVVTSVEQLFGAKDGASKKNAALNFVSNALCATDAVAGKTIVDPNKFQDGLGKVIDGVVACLNASVWAAKQQ
jgi:hypothetical protein